MKTRVFVYGTLKKGNNTRGLNLLSDDAQFVAEAETLEPKFNLYDLGQFPAVTQAGVNRIKGEVWEISNELLTEHLDAIEGYPNFYTRDLVYTTGGLAWMYHIANIEQYATDDQLKTAAAGELVSWNK